MGYRFTIQANETLPFLRLDRWVGTILYILILGYVPWDIGVGRYQQYQRDLKPQFEYLQKLVPSLHWLNGHTERESVIVSNPYIYSTASMLTIYTHNNVYVSEYAQYYTIPSMSEIQDRLYSLMYFMGITSQENFQKFMRGIHVSGSFSEYQEKRKKEFYSELKKYRADYLFYGPKELVRQAVRPAPEQPASESGQSPLRRYGMHSATTALETIQPQLRPFSGSNRPIHRTRRSDSRELSGQPGLMVEAMSFRLTSGIPR